MFANGSHDSDIFACTRTSAPRALGEQRSSFALYALVHWSKRQPPCFHPIAHSLKKPPGIGVPPLFSTPRPSQETRGPGISPRCMLRRFRSTVVLTLSGLSHRVKTLSLLKEFRAT